MTDPTQPIGRRGLLAAVAAAGLSASAPAALAASRKLPLTAQTTEGPYYLDVAKDRSDVTEGLEGVPLEVRFTVCDTAGKPLRSFDERTALRMHRQVIRLGQLVDDLRSSMREPQNDLLTTAVFPLALLKEALDHTRDRFAQRGIAVDRRAIDLVAASAQPVIDGDAHRLHQVFMNLLENTLAYTDAGGELRIGVTVEGAWTGNCLTLLFDDSAPGVSEDELSRLFDRLFRGETSRSRALEIGRAHV